jgi:hypothetical protein
MVQKILSFAIVLLLFGFSENETEPVWYKGNLHTHSYWSDGDEFPEMIMAWYKSQGYQFVGLSDHNTVADGEKWVKVIKSKAYEDGFQKYLNTYGEKWVTYKVDSGRTHVKLKTYDEYRKLFEDSNFLILKSEEITDRFEGKPIHMNATNIQSLINPQGGTSVLDVMQRNVDAVLKQRSETGKPIMPHINHPNFYYAISTEDMINLKGERFFEVYNGHPLVHNYGDSTRPGTEQMWDQINMAYLRQGKPLMYGLATDDSHNYHMFGGAYSNAGRGWVMVQAEALNAESLIHAMEAGSFYSSTGVTLSRVRFDKNRIELKVKAEKGITYKIEFIGVVRNSSEAKVLQRVGGPSASFKLTKDHMFVRARVTSSKLKENPFEDGDYEMAWTQPMIPK